MDGNGFGLCRDNLDLEELGPELTGDEEAVVRGVICNSI